MRDPDRRTPPSEASRAARRIGVVLGHAWAAPCTAVGLLLAAPLLLAGGRLAWHTGVLEVAAGRPMRRCFGRFCAITFGHVVLAVDAAALARSRGHERVHVRQYEAWGPLFFPAYLLSSLAAWWRGGDPYRDNRFEIDARRRSGDRR